jgi:hypothetical protein
MQREGRPGQPTTTIALLCLAPRMRRILRLALQAGGHLVLDWTDPASPPRRPASALVIDLDSLGWTPSLAAHVITAFACLAATPVLMITIYPYEPDGLASGRRLAVLQPPFGPDAFVACVHSLLDEQPAHL